jgi:uncharacterized protein (DUF427 family)
MRAIWNDTVIAESDDTVVVENNHYFPADSIKREYFHENANHTVCPWKGTASYYDVKIGNDINPSAAWYYPDPSQKAREITGRVAFWKGIRVER